MNTLASTSHPAEVTNDQLAARVWLTRHLGWERRLAELRQTSDRAHHPAETEHHCPDAERPAPLRVRVWRSLSAVLLGATLTAGVMFIAPPTTGSSTRHELTPVVADPSPSRGVASNCHWRPHGWFCLPASEPQPVTTVVSR